MKTPFALGLAAAILLAGGAQAQLPGVGLPPIGLPTFPSSPLPPPVRSQPPASAPVVKLPKSSASPVSPQPLAGGAMATPGLQPIPTAMPGAIPGTLGAISSGVGLDAVPVVGTDGATDLVLRAGSQLSKATGAVSGAVEDLASSAGSYRRQARDLLQRHGEAVEADDRGQPVVRGEIAGLGIAQPALARAQAAGFKVRSRETIAGLGLETVILAPPRGMAAVEAIRRLRALDPAGRYDFNHIYFESGAVQGGSAAPGDNAAASGRGLRIGLVDGTAQATALARAQLVQRAFAPGGSRVTAHATAVASLLAGSGAGFRGAAPGATLYVADVYGTTAAGGSALSVARALGWLAQQNAPVINISLVGPPNALLAAGVATLVGKGYVVVAAVGNDGPAAPPLYPAAYPGVVAVTAVDARRRVLPEAGRGPYVGFAAPGADMAAAGLDGRLVGVRGASFAAPLAAGRLARLLPAPDPEGAQRAIAALGREAVDLGAPGRDPVYGRGLVAFDLAVRPTNLAARQPAEAR